MTEQPPQHQPALEGRLAHTVTRLDGYPVMACNSAEGISLPLLRLGTKDGLDKENGVGVDAV
ncbi:MAG: hypothetical protein ACPH64_08250 [Porticoccaceae bacterium]